MSNLPPKNISEGYYKPWGCHQKILAMHRFVSVVELFDVLHEAKRTVLREAKRTIFKKSANNPVHRFKTLSYIYPVARTKRFPEDVVLVNISTGGVAKLLDAMIRASDGSDDSDSYFDDGNIYDVIHYLSSNDPQKLRDGGVWDREAFESYEGLMWVNHQQSE